ncbi:MAG TPA: DUF2207 domain-containing protein [Trueperaceae bacterium]|nr:DUF2207 domain-containing protein [Trueperaceae bacterium]HRP46248.1 DUF2207 domain-containing protein [Trueperaceae bacterium]
MAHRQHKRIALAINLFLLLSAAFAQSYLWSDVVQVVQIMADGSVIVDDTRTLSTDADFGEAFICVKLTPSQRLTLLDGSGALGNGPSSTAYQQQCSGGTEVVVRNSTRVKERRVRFVYRLENSLDVRSDVAQWYWQILEQEHPPVRGYHLTVTAPGPSPAPYDAYVHRFGNTELPTVVLSADRSQLDVSFNRIADGDGVEIRFLMDPALFEVKSTRPGMEEFLQDEAKVAGVQTLMQIRRSPWWALLPLALFGITGSGAIGAYRRFGREPQLETMKYPFEPPSDLPPAAVTSILQQTAATMGPAFHATIMDLMRRGYGEFDTSVNKGKDFAINLNAKTDAGNLQPFELDVLNYLHAAAAPGTPERLSSQELKAYSQRRASTFMAAWGPKVRKWLEAKFGGPLTSQESREAAKRASRRLLLGALVSLVLAFVLAGTASAIAIALTVAQVIAAILAGIGIMAWRPEVAAEVYGWKGFKRTLTDYTRMKDAPLDFFKLWDVYYCYAAALGVADAYLKTLQKAAPLAGVDESVMMSRATWMTSGNYSSLANMSSLSRSISSLSTALNSASASASSGGSSSGGGGGGGGGSSGGR